MTAAQAAEPGLSIRAYARRRGCNEASVRKRIKAGHLDGAILPDGRIDAAVADFLWLRTRTRAPSVTRSGALASANRKRLRAIVKSMAYRVDRLRDSLVPADDVAELAVAVASVISAALAPLPRDLAPRLAGQKPSTASTIMKVELEAVLTAISELPVTPVVRDNPVPPLLALDRLDEAALSAVKAGLHTARTELLDGRQRGALLEAKQVEFYLLDGLTKASQRLRYLHGKVAPRCIGMGASGIERLLRAEISEATRPVRDWPGNIGKDPEKLEDW